MFTSILESQRYGQRVVLGAFKCGKIIRAAGCLAITTSPWPNKVIGMSTRTPSSTSWVETRKEHMADELPQHLPLKGTVFKISERHDLNHMSKRNHVILNITKEHVCMPLMIQILKLHHHQLYRTDHRGPSNQSSLRNTQLPNSGLGGWDAPVLCIVHSNII